MFTATVHQQAGDKGYTHNLKQTMYRRVKEESELLLPNRDGACVVVEKDGALFGQWEVLDGGRAVWTPL